MRRSHYGSAPLENVPTQTENRRCMNRETEDYLRGMNGESPLSMHGQLGAQHRLEEKSRHEEFMKQIAPQQHTARPHFGGGGGGGGIETPITDDLRHALQRFLSRPIARNISIILRVSVILGVVFLFNSDGNPTWPRTIIGAVVGLILPKIFHFTVFFFLGITEAIVRLIVGGVLAVILLIAVVAAFLAVLIGIGSVINYLN